MSRPVYAPKQIYVGNGSLATYTFDFKIEAKSQLLVIEVDDNGVETQRVLGTDLTYLSSVTFDSVNGGGTVVLQANLPTNYNLILLLANDAPTQPYEFRNKTSFTLKRFESALDFIAGAVQRLTYRGKQSFKLHDLDDEATFNTQFPAGVAAALDRVLTVNPVGDGLTYGPTATEVAAAQGYSLAAAAAQAGAEASEIAAGISETNAGNSETAAALSETNAGNSETAAAISAAAALVSEGNASTSETNALASETAAGLSEVAAALSETNAGNSETAAALSETNASNSETAAALSETASAISAAAALVSENAAAASAIAAATSVQWTQVTKGFADLSTAALTNIIESIELSAKETVHGIMIKHNTAFVGAGITELWFDIGVNAEEDRFVSNFDAIQAVSEIARQEALLLFIGNIGAVTSLKLQATAVGANLDQLTQGSVDIYFLVRSLP